MVTGDPLPFWTNAGATITFRIEVQISAKAKSSNIQIGLVSAVFLRKSWCVFFPKSRCCHEVNEMKSNPSARICGHLSRKYAPKSGCTPGLCRQYRSVPRCRSYPVRRSRRSRLESNEFGRLATWISKRLPNSACGNPYVVKVSWHIVKDMNGRHAILFAFSHVPSNEERGFRPCPIPAQWNLFLVEVVLIW